MTVQWTALARTVCLITLLTPSIVAAQNLAPGFRQYDDYDRYQYLPRLPEGPENPTPFPSQSSEASGNPQVLVERLNGIVILEHASQLTENPEPIEDVSILATSRLLNSHCFYRLASSYLGEPISMLRLNELVRDIILFYRQNDQPVVDVSIPADQEITGGIVQIVVTEGKIGRVHVHGAKYFDPCQLRDQVKLRPGCPIYESVLLREQRWLYRNPFRIVDIELSPGDQQGETDVIFNVKDKLPFRVYAGYEDTGNRTTGLERTLYGINWYNALGRDDQAGYQYTASSDFHGFAAHSGSYSTALANRDILSFYGSFAEFNSPIPGFFANEGMIWQILSRWYRELSPIGEYQHGVTAGFDFKRINTEVIFNGISIPEFEGEADIDQLMVGYHGKKYNCRGSWFTGIDAFLSPGNLSGYNKDADFATIRPDATADYYYARAYFERRRNLPRNLEFAGRITGQLSEGNLLPTEQFGIGGYNSVRGYDINTALGDSGMFVNLELRTRPVPLGLGYKCGLGDAFGCLEDEFSTHVFYDFGAVYPHTPLVDFRTRLPLEESRSDLQGVGLGLLYTLQRRFSLRADYGWGLSDLPSQSSQPRHRIHVGTILSY